MKTIKDYTDDQLRYGIVRCEARIAGVMEYGYMRNATVPREALKQYKDELSKRGQNQLEFNE